LEPWRDRQRQSHPITDWPRTTSSEGRFSSGPTPGDRLLAPTANQATWRASTDRMAAVKAIRLELIKSDCRLNSAPSLFASRQLS
jgi:hypothetical protein